MVVTFFLIKQKIPMFIFPLRVSEKQNYTFPLITTENQPINPSTHQPINNYIQSNKPKSEIYTSYLRCFVKWHVKI